VKIFLDSVGCRLNQSEIETYARQFHAAGHTLVATPEQADLVVVNTCSVTTSADSDSRGKIRRAARGGVHEIVVTGCWSALNPEAAAALPSVSRVVPNLEKDHLVADLLGISQENFDLEPVARQSVPGTRLRTRAFIKAQDGCDNRCTFCVTTLARGPGRSRTLEQVLTDIQAAMDGDCQEVVLTGVHLGSWGQDFTPALELSHLVREILERSAIPRLRLSSLEPWDLDADFFRLWENPRLCRHLHLPLQSGCAATLRRMARKTTPESYASLVAVARATVTDMAITTDVIAGFPGECEDEFAESMAFVRQMDFAGGHVFTYSARPGTVAGRMPDQIPHMVRKERSARMRRLLAESAGDYQEGFLGRVLPVLWECATGYGPDGWQLSGLTDNYLRVSAQAPRQCWNRITPVRLMSLQGDVLQGQLQLSGCCD
jgi:threonylcarbamoyladenosine tRNA methylthiotransferase MtaB